MVGLEGLFTTPDQIRNNEVAQLQKQGANLSYLGGSMSGLLGQLAASGGITGSALGMGVRDALGMQTEEQKKAADIASLVKSVDFNNPDSLQNAALQLNKLGYAKEAIALIDRGRQVAVENMKIEDAEFARDNRTRQINYAVPITEVDPFTGVASTKYQNLTITEVYDPDSKTWKPRRGTPQIPVNAVRVGEQDKKDIPEIIVVDPKVTTKQKEQQTQTQDVSTSPLPTTQGTPMPSVFDNPLTGVPQTQPKLQEAQRIVEGLSEPRLVNLRKAYDQYSKITRQKGEQVMSFDSWLFDMVLAGHVKGN